MHPVILAALLTLPGLQTPSPTPDKSIQTAGVQVRELKGRLVEHLPSVPVYRGARVESSYEKLESSRAGYEANWSTGASVSRVVTWYRRVLPRQGWKILEHNKGRDDQNMLIQKDGRNAYLWVERKGKVTQITVEFPIAQEVR